MRRVAVYPGSFNPWHSGHKDVLNKSLQVFDKVIVAIGHNPGKPAIDQFTAAKGVEKALAFQITTGTVEVETFKGLLSEYINMMNEEEKIVSAVVRGLRNSADFEGEKIQQFWNEDLGLSVPTMYFISDRKLVHVSSSAIRMIDKVKEYE